MAVGTTTNTANKILVLATNILNNFVQGTTIATNLGPSPTAYYIIISVCIFYIISIF